MPHESRPGPRRRAAGFSLLELVLAVAIGGVLLGGIGSVVQTSLAAREQAERHHDLTRELRFALARITRAAQGASQLILPLNDKTNTATRDESLRDPGVLAMTLGRDIDRDADGTPDADNDGDGRFDEDPPGDLNFDFGPGIIFIDDDDDGLVDEYGRADDEDESTFTTLFGDADEDPYNGVDDDDDGLIDEDPPDDLNADGAPGLAGVDDDGDGLFDEGSSRDDDEDGQSDEDWLDSVVFYLSGTNLIERIPVPWDETGVGGITGRDFIQRTIAENVTGFKVDRRPPTPGAAPLVEVTLEVTAPNGELLAMQTVLRVGQP